MDIDEHEQTLKRAVETSLADHPQRDERLVRLRRRIGFLDDPQQRAVVYLREIAEVGDPPDEDLVVAVGEEVATAVGLLVQTEDDSFADVVLRAAQHPLARDVLQTDVGEELDRLAHLPERPADRWDLLILCQALLDRAMGGDDSPDPEPVVIETDDQLANVYVHPVHGDVVILVRPKTEGAPEQWVLIDKAHKGDLVLGLIAEKLERPLDSGLVPWLEDKGIRHHIYGADEMGGDTALA